MNEQLETLKNHILDLALEIEESKETIKREFLMNKLFEISGEVDDILQNYEKRTEQIKELLL